MVINLGNPWRKKRFNKFGLVKIWMYHDKDMGKCVFEDGFITPNMPKLQYAIRFSTLNEFRIINKLNKSMLPYKTMHVFEKRDGFNLLFYMYKDEVIPKTRMLPIAGGKIQQVLRDDDFPLTNIERILRDGYIPYFEAWGTRIIQKYKIGCGNVNKAMAQKIEDLPDLNVDMIYIYDGEHDKHIHPKEMMKIAKTYDLNHVKFIESCKITVDNVLRLMDKAEALNNEYGCIVTEGYVAHCYLKESYDMFKIKPKSVMMADILKTKKLVPLDIVKKELGKVFLEVDLEELAKNPVDYLNMVFDYIRESYSLSKRDRKNIMYLFSGEISQELLRKYPDITLESAGRKGYHKMIIGALYHYLKKHL